MPVWLETNGPDLAQGDLITNLVVPKVRLDFPTDTTIDAVEIDAVVATQSCDLANSKTPNAVIVRAFRILEFEAANPHYARNRRNWNVVLRGGIHALYLLPSEDGAQLRDKTWVIDFREVYSLPIPYLQARAVDLGGRATLCSPYVEHFSQAFARFFMRVALPEEIPPFP
jgi:hypothetical protein